MNPEVYREKRKGGTVVTTELVLKYMSELTGNVEKLASLLVQLAKQAEQDDRRITDLESRLRRLEQMNVRGMR